MTDYRLAFNTVCDRWNDTVAEKACKAYTHEQTFDEFLKTCTACGGNWGGMLLTGIDEQWPEVWKAIPDDMGHNAFDTILALLILLGVQFPEEQES